VREDPAPAPLFLDDLSIALRRGNHLCATKYLISNYISLHRASSSLHAFVVSLSSIFIPNTYKQAMSSSSWKSAMVEEMSTLHQNQT